MDKEKEALLALAAKESAKEKVLSMLGFAMRARKLVSGADKVCDEIRRHGHPSEDEKTKISAVGIVLLASDASANTKKRIRNACTYYNVELIQTEIGSDRFAERIGKSSAAAVVATFDRGFAEGIRKANGTFSDNRLKRV